MTDTDLKLVTLEKPADADAGDEPEAKSEETVDESVEDPEEGEKFMFLKVTMK